MTDPGARITEWAQTSQRLVSQAGAIMLEANDQIRDGTFDAAQWTRSAHQLVNLAMTGGLELAPGMMSIACVPQSSGELELSDFIEVDPDNECERTLSVSKPFVADGAPSCAIPNEFIVFVPGILRVYATRFRVGVTWPDLQSGTYRGEVRLTNVKTGAAQVKDVIVDV
ncbi:MAG: hypothetical protein ACRDTN_08655 [Mycobacterium sp.]